MQKLFSLLALLGVTSSIYAGAPLALESPDGRITVQISPGAQASFKVGFAGNPIVTGTLGVSVEGTNLLEGAVVEGQKRTKADSSYTVPFNKSNPVRDHYKELVLDLRPAASSVKKLRVVFRAYDDGVAYRYIFPEQGGADSIEITDEPGTFQFEGDPQVWPLYLPSYTTSHEGNYQSCPLSGLATNRLIDVPLLVQFENGVSVAIAQANLRNYGGLYLIADQVGNPGRLRCSLPPLPGQQRVKVRSGLPLSSPWRVMMIGEAPGRLIESNLLLNLNEPNAIADSSWLKAGKATFYWWSGVQAPVDVVEAVKWEKGYVDFAATNGFAFHAVIGTEGNHPWYHQTRAGYHPPGPDADATRVRDGFDLKQIVDYGRSKGVGIRLWVHWKPLSEKLEEAFAQYERWGIAGLMVDFLDRDDQEMVRFAEEVLKSAARHHLHIQFHGVWAPTGLSRTYPNLFNHEGVLNLEYLRGSDRCSPEHNLIVPFTRMLAGPMDYHLGGFRAATRETFKARRLLPMVLGSRAHQLAMYVVYENPMPMVVDVPSAYLDQPGFDFLKQVPTDWDETRVLSGKVGDYIVVARRKGTDWFLGAMTDWTPRLLEVPLDFLGKGEYEAVTWADAEQSRDPNQLAIAKTTLNRRSRLSLDLAGGGGQVVWIHPAR